MIEKEFQNTEIGQIPQNWGLVLLRQGFDFRSNNTLSRDALADSGIVKNVHYGDVLVKFGANIDVQNDDLPYVADSNYRSGIYAADGDIVIADTAEDETVGKATELLNVKDSLVVSGLHTMWLHPTNPERFAKGYLGYAFNSALFHDQLIPLMQGTKVTSVSKGAIKNTFIALPPLDEQKKIASALTSIDNLLSEFDVLIAKKRNIKQGVMQQLLTGSTRLEGYSTPWIDIKLGDMGFTYNGLSGKSASDFGHGQAKYVTFLNVLNNPIIDCSIFESVDVKDGERQNDVQKGDLLFNTSSETPEEVGICATLDENVERLYLNSFCFGYRLKSEYSPKFLAYFFRSKQGRDLMKMLAQGSTRYNLSKENLMKSSITIPQTKEEQNAIATVLSDMDKEIAQLESRKSKYEAIKQGMMQQLLTGKIRLIN